MWGIGGTSRSAVPATLALIAAGALAVGGISLWAEGTADTAWFQAVAWAALGTYTAGVRHRRVRTLPWLLLGLGFAVFAVAALVAAVADHAWAADGVHLLGYPFIVVGLAALVWPDGATAPTATLIEAAIVLVPVAVIVWITAIAPAAAVAGLGSGQRVVAVARPLGDLACLAMLARLVAGFGPDARRTGQPALGLLVAALAAVIASDLVVVHATISGDSPRGGWGDAAALVGYISLAALASSWSIVDLSQPHRRRQAPLSRARLAVLAVVALVTPGILWVQWLRSAELDVPIVLGATAVSFLLVIARMNELVKDVERSRRQLHFDATHDALTGLPNRQLFEMHLDRALREGRAGGVMFVDLDRFKHVNDTFGHHIGDEVLQEVAAMLRAAVRESDLVARLSGDEFVVLVQTNDEPELLAIAHRVVDRLRVSRRTPAGEVTVTASVGLARWEAGTGIDDAHHLLRTADDAMYRAKQARGDQLVVAGA